MGSNSIALINYNNGIDGFTVFNQQMNIIIYEIGIYVKQSSSVLIAVSRNVSVIGNLSFNMSRAAININDGFYSNHILSWNVIFNTVRETGDHRPINTWDRQPYLTVI